MNDFCQKLRYPVGIQSFRTIREDNYLYVDKTAFVRKLADVGKFYFLSRPRRFGKSLLISTLQAYFEGRKELFEGLEISQYEKDWKRYPVLRFDLSAAHYDDAEVIYQKLSTYLADHEAAFGIESDRKTISDRFRYLITSLYNREKLPVVILIDEYDKPMLDSMHDDELHEKLKADIRGFYSVLKECDDMIRFAMLTGVTKFGKVSVFSGLNNLRDISMLPEFNAICGITEKEFHNNFETSIKQFASKNEITPEEAWQEFKKYYDGYHFSYPAEDIYNPFSVINAFADNSLSAYWFESGSPTSLLRLIQKHKFVLQNLEGEQRTKEMLSNISDKNGDIVPFFFQAGYLTIKGYDQRFKKYTLGFPNKEVSEGFWNFLGNYFFQNGRALTSFDLSKFILDLEGGRAEDFMERLQSLFSSISSEHESDKEVHFHNMLTILLMLLSFEVQKEAHFAQGRCDIVLKTPEYIYVIELKVDKSAQAAIDQIHDRGYARPFKSDPREKILIGANFSKDTRTIEDWIIEKKGK